MSLFSSKKSQLVTLATLRNLPPPASLGKQHKPIAHATLVDALRIEAERRGYRVAREQLAVSKDHGKLFGIIDLMPEGVAATVMNNQPVPADRGLSMGFRNSINESIAFKLVAGSRVFVCDNMCLSGDLIALLKKNTRNLDLATALIVGFDKFLQHASILDQNIARMQAAMITDNAAKEIIFDVFSAEILPVSLFEFVDTFYFHPADDWSDCTPRTRFGLYNAFTRSMKMLSHIRQLGAGVELGRHFGLTAALAAAE